MVNFIKTKIKKDSSALPNPQHPMVLALNGYGANTVGDMKRGMLRRKIEDRLHQITISEHDFEKKLFERDASGRTKLQFNIFQRFYFSKCSTHHHEIVVLNIRTKMIFEHIQPV